ncbi:MAG: hypothetical protein FWF76_02290 [Oscillospiraceae bacterium]|nr:hypothetical protein [Oscillospiraceae bacterium]
MLVCPKCNAKYKKKLFKKRVYCDCKEKLEYAFTFEDAKVHMLSTPYGDPDKWAESTLKNVINDEELVLIYMIKHGRWHPYVRERFWLHDILDDNDILYKVVLSGEYKVKSAGARRGRKFNEWQGVYVRKADEDKALELIKEYEEATQKSGAELEIEPSNNVSEVCDKFDADNKPQVTCTSCKKTCDSDYSNCPYCKKPLY